MGGVTTPELAVAVSEAGGLGMLSVAARPALPQALERVEEQLPGGLYGVGFFAAGIDEELLDLAASKARVIDVFWGEPASKLVDRIHQGGALAFWQAGSEEELLAAVDAGCDAIVAQGIEAGGHVRGTVPLLELLEAVVPKVEVPVVASGGIASGRAMAAALEAGASAVRLGTRFVATTESAAHPVYLEALVAADGSETVLTTAFGVGWPDAPHRVLRSALDSAEAFEGEIAAIGVDGDETWEVPRFATNPPSRYLTGQTGAMAQYAGTGVTDVVDVQPAGRLVATIAAEAERLAPG
jgi:NAD(P)H-dependent flavin oxidoreductase YrpB (nitropropane dioxygenase family)